MGLFKRDKVDATLKTTTAITKGIHVVGNISGEDHIHISGSLKGDIVTKSSVVIGHEGSVTGDIRASKVKVFGRLDGDVVADEIVECEEGCVVNSHIKANKVFINGKHSGTIQCKELHIEINGSVENRVQAKEIEVSGRLEGDIACEHLSAKNSAFIKGHLYVNSITNRGATLEGSMSEYQALFDKREDESSTKELDIKELVEESQNN